MKVILYLHLHQPWRLGRFRFLDLGSGKPYFDIDRNLSIFKGIAERSYRPALDRLHRALDNFPEFRFSLSVTGTFLEQARMAAPDVIDRLRSLYRTGRVAFLGETYYHSLAFLLPPPELSEEVALHREMLQKEFGAQARALRMTELAYSDDLARFAEAERFRGMLAEGWEGVLHGRAGDLRVLCRTGPHHRAPPPALSAQRRRRLPLLLHGVERVPAHGGQVRPVARRHTGGGGRALHGLRDVRRAPPGSDGDPGFPERPPR